MAFADRRDAGRRLAPLLLAETGTATIVLGLPRGGVLVAAEVAAALQAPLDVLVAAKLRTPERPELALGAVAEDGGLLLDAPLIRRLGVPVEAVGDAERTAREEVARRVARYRPARPRLDLAGRTTIVIDDGIATGSTALVACRAARSAGAARVVIAVPVAPPGWSRAFAAAADEAVAALIPAGLRAVGDAYEDFRQTTDEEVLAALAGPEARRAPA
ncbi:phosphoribosyltransferase family protein [Amnibacterium sp. CER49]|uniref:phosphoribosyltransferase n=1 Tax=Amnibacterium sp. CER49 TaxID=3039161 RepID=UPI00244C4491|nr:phosphoribosyltransferase family protein [Amnibacterium sp. CER49]MDH2444780.1 phosphoribosyltransferase family protein [Amnibacterium sp. CER49]